MPDRDPAYLSQPAWPDLPKLGLADYVLFQLVYEKIDVAIFMIIVSADRDFVLISLSSAKVAGLSPEDFLADATARKVRTHYQHCLEQATTIEYEQTRQLSGRTTAAVAQPATRPWPPRTGRPRRRSSRLGRGGSK